LIAQLATGDAIIAVILLLLLCVVAGFLVKLTVFKKLSDWLDEKLAGLFPAITICERKQKLK
jgi:hypothetical protein